MRIIKSTYYSNWGDRIGYPLARILVKPLSKITFLTPNHVTVISFLIYIIGSIVLTMHFENHGIIAGFLIFLGYVGDDIDGQLARITGKTTIIGDFLDKVLDIIKIFAITFFASLAVFYETGQYLFILLGFIACAFFNLRYYIKLETMYSAISRNNNFLSDSAEKRKVLEAEMDILYQKKATSLSESIRLCWIKNRTFLLADEAEFAIVISLGAAFNKLDWALWFFAISQVVWAFWRFKERSIQLKSNSKNLLKPLRK